MTSSKPLDDFDWFTPSPESWHPCGECENCRRGFPGICFSIGRRTNAPALPAERGGRACPVCGLGLAPRRRFCDECRDEKRRASWRKARRAKGAIVNS